MNDRKLRYAVVGASNNTKKYGYIICDFMRQNNISFIPVNPKETEICGRTCFPDFLDLDVDVLIFVVPTNISMKLIKTIWKSKCKRVWFQHGSFDYKVVGYCKKNKIKYNSDECIMVHLRQEF